MRLAGRTILVLEDEPLIAMTLEDLLTDEGASPIVVETLEAAFALLDQRVPDVAILDVNINGSDSFQFAASLAVLEVPFIFATGYGQARNFGAFASVPTVAKPYDIDDIVGALVRAVASRR